MWETSKGNTHKGIDYHNLFFLLFFFFLFLFFVHTDILLNIHNKGIIGCKLIFLISATSPLESYAIYHKAFCTQNKNYSCTPTKCDFLLKYAKYVSIMKPTCLPLPQSWSPTPGTLSQKLLLYNVNYYKALDNECQICAFYVILLSSNLTPKHITLKPNHSWCKTAIFSVTSICGIRINKLFCHQSEWFVSIHGINFLVFIIIIFFQCS